MTDDEIESGGQFRDLIIEQLLKDPEIEAVAFDTGEDPEDSFYVLYCYYATGPIIAVAVFPERLHTADPEEWESILAEVSVEVEPDRDGYRLPDSYFQRGEATRPR